MRPILFLLPLAIVLASASPGTAQPRLGSNWRADIELTPGAVLPFLGKFASADVSIYPGGVTAESTFLRAWSRNQSPAIRIEHVLARLYSDMPLTQIRPTLLGLAGAEGAIAPKAALRVDPPRSGRVRGLDAQLYRMHLSKRAHLDVWMTNVIPVNPQFRRIQGEFLSAVSPAAAAEASRLPGTPVFVELNTPKHQKVVLLRLERVAVNTSADDERDALSTGTLYARAPFSDRFWRR